MTVGQYDASNPVDDETGGVAGPSGFRVEGPRGGGPQNHHSRHHLREGVAPCLRGGGSFSSWMRVYLHREIPLHARSIHLLWPQHLERVPFPHR